MRTRKNEYLYEIQEEYEGFWSRPGHKHRGYKFYHLIIKLNTKYNSVNEAVEGLKYLESVLGPIPRYNTPFDEDRALTSYESDDIEYIQYGCINAKLRRKANGWIADLWLLNELTDWNLLAITREDIKDELAFF